MQSDSNKKPVVQQPGLSGLELDLSDFDFSEDLRRLREISKTFEIQPDRNISLNGSQQKVENNKDQIKQNLNEPNDQKQICKFDFFNQKSIISAKKNIEGSAGDEQQGLEEKKSKSNLQQFQSNESSLNLNQNQPMFSNSQTTHLLKNEIKFENVEGDIHEDKKPPSESLQLPPNFQISSTFSPKNSYFNVNQNNELENQVDKKSNKNQNELENQVDKKSNKNQNECENQVDKKSNKNQETLTKNSSELQRGKETVWTSDLSYVMALSNRQIPNLPPMSLKRKNENNDDGKDEDDGNIFKKPPPKKIKPNENIDLQTTFQKQDVNNGKESNNDDSNLESQRQKIEQEQKDKICQQKQQEEEDDDNDEDIYGDTQFGNQVGVSQNNPGDFLDLYGKQDKDLKNLGSEQQQNNQQLQSYPKHQSLNQNQQSQLQKPTDQQQIPKVGSMESQQFQPKQEFQLQHLQQQQSQQLQQQQKQQNAQKKGGQVEFGLLATLNEWKTSNPDKAYTVRHQRPYFGNGNNNNNNNNNKWQSMNKPGPGPGPPSNNQGVPSLQPIQPPPLNFAAQHSGVQFQGSWENAQGAGAGAGAGQGPHQHGGRYGGKRSRRGRGGGRNQKQQGGKKGQKQKKKKKQQQQG